MSTQKVLIGLLCVEAIALLALVGFNKLVQKHDCLIESQVTDIVEVRAKSVIWKSHEIIFQTGKNVELGDVFCVVFNGNDDFRLSEQIYVNPAIQNPLILSEKLEFLRASIKQEAEYD